MNSRHASFIALLNPFLQYKYMITAINMWIPRSGPRPAWRYIHWKLPPVVLTQKRKLRLKPQWMQWMIQSPGQGQGILLTSYSAASGREFLFWFNFTAGGLMVVSRVWFLGYTDTPGGLVQQCAWTFPQDGQLNVVGHIIPNESRVCSLGVGDL